MNSLLVSCLNGYFVTNGIKNYKQAKNKEENDKKMDMLHKKEKLHDSGERKFQRNASNLKLQL
jgi:hypothetical protein